MYDKAFNGGFLTARHPEKPAPRLCGERPRHLPTRHGSFHMPPARSIAPLYFAKIGIISDIVKYIKIKRNASVKNSKT